MHFGLRHRLNWWGCGLHFDLGRRLERDWNGCYLGLGGRRRLRFNRFGSFLVKLRVLFGFRAKHWRRIDCNGNDLISFGFAIFCAGTRGLTQHICNRVFDIAVRHVVAHEHKRHNGNEKLCQHEYIETAP